MFVKYIGSAMERTVPKADLDIEVAENDLEVNLVWDSLNGHTVELSEQVFETLQSKTSRGEWAVVDEMPELPSISAEEIQSVNDDDTLPDTGQEPSESGQE